MRLWWPYSGVEHSDFDKSMTSIADHRVWQDVYKPSEAGERST